MNYDETLAFMYAQLPMFSKVGGSAIKPGLDNILKLCAYFDNPQHKFKSIHVAGTNGKGSTTHALASIFQANNYKTGLYTSPHIVDFRERIKINGTYCSKEFVVDFIKQCMPYIDEIHPSFFELTVVMAFYYFAINEVDIAIIETGLGGRLDSTNIIVPMLAIITNISYDHQTILGNTLPEISKEKAGIIKPNIPVLIGRRQEDIKHVFYDTALANNAPIYYSDEIVTIANTKLEEDYIEINGTINKEKFSIQSDLRSNYQIENITTALAATELIKQHYSIHLDNKNGLSNIIANTKLLGRWQQLQKNPRVIIDVAHNEDGIKKALQQLSEEQYDKLHIIFGAVKDKDTDAILRLLPKNASYYFTEPNNERKLDVATLYNIATKYNLEGHTYSTTKQALQNSLEIAALDDLILITGSFFILEGVL